MKEKHYARIWAFLTNTDCRNMESTNKGDFLMNNTIELLHNHTSFRSYTSQPLTEEQIDAIFQAANQTSSFSLLQAVSIIRITDPVLRKNSDICVSINPILKKRPNSGSSVQISTEIMKSLRMWILNILNFC